MKKYKAIFFDWDGTAVSSRRAPANEAAAAMRPLLAQGVKLVIVSGTTLENIAQGNFGELFTKEELGNLYLGLGRGAYNYAFDENGQPYVFADCLPTLEGLLDIHRACFSIHMELLERYRFPTDIVFTRPNYCKIDLMVERQRGESLFMQGSEIEQLKESLKAHRIEGGLRYLLELASNAGAKYGLKTEATCDAKYLEVGISSKSNNVNTILQKLNAEDGIEAGDCCFWGDEYVGIEPGVYGSDSFMYTDQTCGGDFFDVSETPGERPMGVRKIGGGIAAFLDFLREQADA